MARAGMAAGAVPVHPFCTLHFNPNNPSAWCGRTSCSSCPSPLLLPACPSPSLSRDPRSAGGCVTPSASFSPLRVASFPPGRQHIRWYLPLPPPAHQHLCRLLPPGRGEDSSHPWVSHPLLRSTPGPPWRLRSQPYGWERHAGHGYSLHRGQSCCAWSLETSRCLGVGTGCTGRRKRSYVNRWRPGWTGQSDLSPCCLKVGAEARLPHADVQTAATSLT